MYELEDYNTNERIFIDVETISWDDNREALSPHHGHRITTVIIGQVGKKTRAYPIRNRNSSNLLLPLDYFLKELRTFIYSIKIYANLNCKFDMNFFYVDGVYFNDDVICEDTGTLARLVRNDQILFNLEDLAIQYRCVNKKLTESLDKYLGKSKDYGIIPVDVLCTYGIADVDTTIELHMKLLRLLPEESTAVWQNECKFVMVAFGVESRGIAIDTTFLKKRRIRLIQGMMQLVEKIAIESNGIIHNPGSNPQIAAFFLGQGIDPVMYNDPTEKMVKEGAIRGNASWGSDALEQINHPIASLLIEYKGMAIQESTFCAGWMSAVDSNNVIHPTIKSNGTKTGRPSACEPNVYNPPKWIMEAITIPEGMIGVKWDKSQIEYRIFTHYSEDVELLQKYKDNPRIDYHAIIAERLGLPRDPVKNVNFGMLYGMGSPKTTRTLAAKFGDLDRDPKSTPLAKAKIRDALRKYVRLSGGDRDGKLVTSIRESGHIQPECFTLAAQAILAEFHVLVPAVKKLQNRVKNVLQVRGYLKNFFGRRYYYPANLAYIGLNALCQGSAADLFKMKLVELFKESDKRIHLIDMIYDSCFCIMPIECAQKYWEDCQRIVCTSPLNVPICIDGEVALHNWCNITKIQNNNVLESAALLCKTSSK